MNYLKYPVLSGALNGSSGKPECSLRSFLAKGIERNFNIVTWGLGAKPFPPPLEAHIHKLENHAASQN